MNWLFYLDDLEIEEPLNFSDLEISILRDENYHGMTFQASTSSLKFHGAAYDYLQDQKRLYGIRANVRFRALVTCETYDYEEVINGRLNFSKYTATCGSDCIVELPWEQDSCEVILKSRIEQKVDMDKNTGSDGLTPLSDYTGLAVETELPAKELDARIEGYVSDAGDVAVVEPDCDTNQFIWVRPDYGRKLFESINQSNLTPINFFQVGHDNIERITPQLLFDDNVNCFSGEFEYNIRMKGNWKVNNATLPASTPFGARIQLVLLGPDAASLHCDPGNIFDYSCVVDQVEYAFGTGAAGQNFDVDFDETLTGTVVIPSGYGLYAWLYFPMGFSCGDALTVTFAPETYFRLSTTKLCPATTAELYLIHEALSRAAEAVTNGCVRVKSEYYGRTDSEPFSFSSDGCGGLRTVTSGLKIRKADDDRFFVSLKELMDGLRAIDNIGAEVTEDETIPGRFLLRIESLDYFYRDIEILRHDHIPDMAIDTEEQRHYSRVNVGYKKWEIENVNGLDEFNSTREYATSLDTVNNPLDIQSGLVAGSYAIEITREQSFAETGATDTKYDNETFIICMRRLSYPYGSIEVETGNIDSAENIFSPGTIYNYRISPIRNLMRWYRSIAAGLAGSLSNSENKLFFASGTGNLLAKGKMTDAGCRLESVAMQENQNLFVTHFDDPADYTPLWKNETKSYTYLMSVGDYKSLKTNPYGYVSVQCGSGDFVKHWIKEIRYRPAEGSAVFVLREKYSQ